MLPNWLAEAIIDPHESLCPWWWTTNIVAAALRQRSQVPLSSVCRKCKAVPKPNRGVQQQDSQPLCEAVVSSALFCLWSGHCKTFQFQQVSLTQGCITLQSFLRDNISLTDNLLKCSTGPRTNLVKLIVSSFWIFRQSHSVTEFAWKQTTATVQDNYFRFLFTCCLKRQKYNQRYFTW